MKSYIKIAMIGIFCASTLFAEGIASANAPTVDKRVLMQEKMARRAKRIQERGGFIEIPPSGNVIRIVNAQKRITEAELKDAIDVFRNSLQLPVIWKDAEIDSKDPAKLAKLANKEGNCAAAIILFENSESARILIAPENGWASINVAKLAEGDPSHEQLIRRVRQEYWRAAGMLLGGYVSQQQPCLMTLIVNNAGLDNNVCVIPAVEVLPKINATAKKLGIKPGKRIIYERACQEGWAPAPTNEYQKAIWDKVHQLPTKPITIKPETKPVKD